MGLAIKWGCGDCGHTIWTAIHFPFMVYENGVLEPWQGHERTHEYGAWKIISIQTTDGIVRIKVVNGHGFCATQAYCSGRKTTRLMDAIVERKRISAVGFHWKGDVPDRCDVCHGEVMEFLDGERCMRCGSGMMERVGDYWS